MLSIRAISTVPSVGIEARRDNSSTISSHPFSASRSTSSFSERRTRPIPFRILLTTSGFLDFRSFCHRSKSISFLLSTYSFRSDTCRRFMRSDNRTVESCRRFIIRKTMRNTVRNTPERIMACSCVPISNSCSGAIVTSRRPSSVRACGATSSTPSPVINRAVPSGSDSSSSVRSSPTSSICSSRTPTRIAPFRRI